MCINCEINNDGINLKKMSFNTEIYIYINIEINCTFFLMYIITKLIDVNNFILISY